MVAFPWRRSGSADALARAVAGLVARGGQIDAAAIASAGATVRAAERGDQPTVPTPTIPTVGVTGTNGKTTTTRLIAAMARHAGNRVGWTSTDGVYVDGVLVEDGDWSGYGGAGQVLSRDDVDVAVLEIARGGILLRGIGTTRLDVAVVTNVSADHLGLLGIDTLDELAEVKATIVRIVEPAGWAVLNGDDPRVLAMRHATRARPFVFAIDPRSPAIRESLGAGGAATTVIDGHVTVLQANGDADALVPLVDVPVTIGGVSTPNVSNVLAATAAATGLGLPRKSVIGGLTGFVPDPQTNPGRMNIYGRADRTVIVDMAHNEASLRALLEVTDGIAGGGARWVVLGMAGDRTDELLRSVGEMAALGAEHVVIGEKERYFRGRERDAMTELMRSGALAGGATHMPAFPTELDAMAASVTASAPGDVVAVMCHAEREALADWLRDNGFRLLTPAEVRDRVSAGRGRR